MRISKPAIALSAALAAMAAPAVAQDGPGISAATGPGIGVTFGLGASIKPDYFGSDDYGIGPSANARIDYIRLPGGFEIGTGRAAGFVEGFGLRGSARYVGKRDDDDNSELDGMDDVDATLELGLGVGYDASNWRAYGVARYGFFGHEAFVGQIGADAIYRPTDQLIVNIGPRFDFGTGKRRIRSSPSTTPPAASTRSASRCARATSSPMPGAWRAPPATAVWSTTPAIRRSSTRAAPTSSASACC